MFYLFLIQNNDMSVKQKPKVKRLGEKKCQVLKDLESGLSNKEVAKKHDFKTRHFSLLVPFNYLPLVSQCTIYSFSFTTFLNPWTT